MKTNILNSKSEVETETVMDYFLLFSSLVLLLFFLLLVLLLSILIINRSHFFEARIWIFADKGHEEGNFNGDNPSLHYHQLEPYVRFMSYSKCSNWRWMLKLLSNFGCLFPFYLDGANSIKTDLYICNFSTGQFVSYKSVI